MKASIFVLLIVLLVPSGLLATREGFTAARYIRYNQTIIEGTIIADSKCGSLEWIGPGHFVPTNCGAVVVERVLKCAKGISITSGDTLKFCYPTSNRAESNVTVSPMSQLSSLVVGSKGLFPFDMSEKFGLVFGCWFRTSDAKRIEILDLMAQIEADSTILDANLEPDIPAYKSRHKWRY